MIENVLEVTRLAGEIVRTGFGKNFSIETKTNDSNIVTDIDKKSEEAIINYINKKFPSHGILAEESGADLKNSEYIWVVDPIDGTTNFAHGLPIFSVSIGLTKNGKTICGAVYDVMRDMMYSAELGSGSFVNWEKIRVTDNSNMAKSVLVTGFPYNIKDNPDNAVEKFTAFLNSCRAVRRLGSAAIDLCYLAQGIFDGFWEVSLHPWDFCAGQLIVEEAGGKVTDFNNNQLTINSSQLLASNNRIHEKMLQILREN